MGEGTTGSIYGVVLLLVVASLAIFSLGLYLRKTDKLKSRKGGLLFALLSVAPLFGGGFVMFAHHMEMFAEGVTKPSVHGQNPEERK
jgi:asparagine N-glycosylation enzyme membrane subunit Stt3